MMKHSSPFFNTPGPQETRLGFIYMAISLVVLPAMLQFGNSLLADPLSAANVNFLYFCINFTVVVWIFRRFLRSQFQAALRIPFPTLWYAVLGYLGSRALGEILALLTCRFFPSFVNVNDRAVTHLLSQDFRLIAAGTILLVPVVEETLYRGLVFRSLYGKNPLAAYLVSMGVFAAIHVLGYIGAYSPLTLLLCFLQYLPAGFCLAWCYRQTGTLAAPILMHTLVNAVGVFGTVR